MSQSQHSGRALVADNGLSWLRGFQIFGSTAVARVPSLDSFSCGLHRVGARRVESRVEAFSGALLNIALWQSFP